MERERNGAEMKGTYALVLQLERQEEIAIGKLGTFTFPAGYYLYVGSALGPGGLEARLARHRPSTSSGHRRRDQNLNLNVFAIWAILPRDHRETYALT